MPGPLAGRVQDHQVGPAQALATRAAVTAARTHLTWGWSAVLAGRRPAGPRRRARRPAPPRRARPVRPSRALNRPTPAKRSTTCSPGPGGRAASSTARPSSSAARPRGTCQNTRRWTGKSRPTPGPSGAPGWRRTWPSTTSPASRPRAGRPAAARPGAGGHARRQDGCVAGGHEAASSSRAPGQRAASRPRAWMPGTAMRTALDQLELVASGAGEARPGRCRPRR